MKKQNVCVIVAHPDDEVLGCGGTMARHCRQGDNVSVIMMADGVTSRSYDPDQKQSREAEVKQFRKEIANRAREAIRACEVLGVDPKNIRLLGLMDQRLDVCPLLDLVKHVERECQARRPTIVYTHFWADLNLDHRTVCQAVCTAFRVRPGKTIPRIFHMEIPETSYLSVPALGKDFRPDHYVDVADVMDLKLKALRMYASESRVYPDPRSDQYLESLAVARGKAGKMKMAEAFAERGFPDWEWWKGRRRP